MAPSRLLAELADEAAVVRAIGELRARGYRWFEAYLPFPSHDIEEALAAARSRLPIAVFVVGMVGAGGAYGLQWLLVGFLYPLVVGGRPPHFPLAFVIITFEMGVLFAAFGSFFGALGLGRLVRLRDAVQGTPGFASVTRDRFWLEVTTHADVFAVARTRADLLAAGALRIEAPEAGP